MYRTAQDKVGALSATLQAAEHERAQADEALDPAPAAGSDATAFISGSSGVAHAEVAQLVALANSRSAGLVDALFGRVRDAELASASALAAADAGAQGALASAADSSGGVMALVERANTASAGALDRLYDELRARDAEAEAAKRASAAAQAKEAEAVALTAELVARANAASAQVIEKLSEQLKVWRRTSESSPCAGVEIPEQSCGVIHAGVALLSSPYLPLHLHRRQEKGVVLP